MGTCYSPQKPAVRPETHFSDTDLWQLIWKMKNLMSTVQIFLWRACHDGLTMAAAMHRRLPELAHFAQDVTQVMNTFVTCFCSAHV
jgi:hypothetical protein